MTKSALNTKQICEIEITIDVFEVLMGTAYSLLASALWPMVALIIPSHQLGTAYGV